MLIGVSGYARSGKDTVANILVEEHGFAKMAFADKVRELALEINPWTLTDDWPRATPLKSLVEHRGWEEAKQYEDVRRTLQRVGMAGRNILGRDVWIHALLGKWDGGDLVISDVRFQNEFNAIKYLGGVVWRVERPNFGPVNDHISEVDLDGSVFDFTVDNWSGFDWLDTRVKRGLYETRRILGAAA